MGIALVLQKASTLCAPLAQFLKNLLHPLTFPSGMQGGRGRDVPKRSAQTYSLRKIITLSLVVRTQAGKIMSRRVNRHGTALTLLGGVKAGCSSPQI